RSSSVALPFSTIQRSRSSVSTRSGQKPRSRSIAILRGSTCIPSIVSPCPGPRGPWSGSGCVALEEAPHPVLRLLQREQRAAAFEFDLVAVEPRIERRADAALALAQRGD